MNRRHRGQGMSLIELLIVLAVISLLIQLSLPAVQGSREAARKAACAEHLRQLGIATQSAIAATGRFPTGGWSWEWVGDPERGDDRGQPGGWIFNSLPYFEQMAIYEYSRDADPARRRAKAAEMEQIPIPEFNCPSRRAAVAYSRFWSYETKNSLPTKMHAKTDYAGNGGSIYTSTGPTPSDYAEEDAGRFEWARNITQANGIFAARSMTTPAQVVDGMSQTYLIGEKYLTTMNYENGLDDGDDFTMYQGDDMDIVRWTMPQVTDRFKELYNLENGPRLDDADFATAYAFGSAHPNGFNVVMCDGSVRSIDYAIAPQVHQALGNRSDGEQVSLPAN